MEENQKQSYKKIKTECNKLNGILGCNKLNRW